MQLKIVKIKNFADIQFFFNFHDFFINNAKQSNEKNMISSQMLVYILGNFVKNHTSK